MFFNAISKRSARCDLRRPTKITPGTRFRQTSQHTRTLICAVRKAEYLVLALTVTLFYGCQRAEKQLVCHNQKHVTESFRTAQQEIPVSLCSSDSIAPSPPLCLTSDLDNAEKRDVTLDECLTMALQNSEIILSSTGGILQNPSAAASVYDQKIQRTGVLFGQRSVAGALTDFDPVLQFDAVWGRDDSVQNNIFSSGGLAGGSALTQETADVNISMRKRLASGGDISVAQIFRYEGENSPSNLFPSSYTSNAQVSFRQPLLAGAGKEYTAIAGPLSGGVNGITGVRQGIIIARINENISDEQFKDTVRRLVSDVEQTYGQLRLQYLNLELQTVQLENTNEALRITRGRAHVGDVGGAADDVADAIDQVLAVEGQIAETTYEILTQETNLRRLMSLQACDGTVLRPIDTPFTGHVDFDWASAVYGAMTRRPELRIQKDNIRSLKYQLYAARSVARPTLDFVSSYTLNGFGDDLLGPRNAAGGPGLGNALGRQFSGNEVGWTLGFQYERPLGLRVAKAQIENLEFQLMKATSVLKVQENELQRELATALREVYRQRDTMERNRKRLQQAEQKLISAKARYKANPEQTSAMTVLRQASAVTSSKMDITAATIRYNQAITDWHLASGQVLTANRMAFASSPSNIAAPLDIKPRHNLPQPTKTATNDQADFNNRVVR